MFLDVIFLKAFVYSKGRLTGYGNVMNNLLLNILALVEWVGQKSDQNIVRYMLAFLCSNGRLGKTQQNHLFCQSIRNSTGVRIT